MRGCAAWKPPIRTDREANGIIARPSARRQFLSWREGERQEAVVDHQLGVDWRFFRALVREINGRRLAGLHGDRLRQRTVALVPCPDRLAARWNVGDREGAVAAADREV